MLIQRIEAYLRRTRMAPTRFGREAMGDPNFVGSLLVGRKPRPRTVDRVVAFIEAQGRPRRAR
jgi:hypothetical protein